MLDFKEFFKEFDKTFKESDLKPRNKNEKCFRCGQKIINTRIIFSKNGKVEGPYCSKKCSETSTLKNEIESSFSDQKVDNRSASKSVIKGIAFLV